MRCAGCHNPELWERGEERSIIDILVDIHDYIHLPHGAKRVLIMGGEPLEQPEYLLYMLINTLKSYGLDVVMFTSYDIESVPDSIKQICDGVKCGKFMLDMVSDNHYSGGMKLASANQKLYKRGVDY